MGAGTGIWSHMLAKRGVEVTAGEPNDAMREAGQKLHGSLPITWVKGYAEVTNLPDNSFDAVCMASFEDVLYLEGHHVEQQSHERYIGLWESINDIRVQAGEVVFSQFLDTVCKKIASLDHIDAEYTTRAWIAKDRG